jgi:alpha-galactosidase
MKKSSLIFSSLLLVSSLVTKAEAFVEDRSNFSVKLKSTGDLVVEKEWKSGPGGQQILNLDFVNHGQKDLEIENIEIRIPIPVSLKSSNEIIYGSSCMGRTPILRETIGKKKGKGKKNKSYSYMYEMVKVHDKDIIFAGTATWKVFMCAFTVENNEVVIRSSGEGKTLSPGEKVDYEPIVLSRGEHWMDLLDSYGDSIVVENDIAPLKEANFKGWATWDYYGRIFDDRDIYENMKALNRLKSKTNLIQIDGGWWTERGDYTSVRKEFPGGIKAIAENISKAGLIPGLHFDGFRGDKASEVYKNHPDYFLHDQDGKVIVDVRQKHDRVMEYIFFDYSHPGALAHIKECVRTMKEEWGIEYFKVDFMRYGIEHYVRSIDKNLKHIVAHDSSITSIERFRQGMAAIREGMGDAYFLGCSAVFGPTIGFVDGMRTGGDVHPHYEAFPERCLANVGNYYLVDKVYNGDCDYLVVRNAKDEDETVSQDGHKQGGTMTENEAKMWADFNVMYGTCRLNSDKLSILRKERVQIVDEAFSYDPMEKTVPLDLWQSATDKMDGFELLLAKRGEEVYLGVFNWNEQEKTYDLSTLGLSSNFKLKARHSEIIPFKSNLGFEELARLFSRDFN